MQYIYIYICIAYISIVYCSSLCSSFFPPEPKRSYPYILTGLSVVPFLVSYFKLKEMNNFSILFLCADRTSSVVFLIRQFRVLYMHGYNQGHCFLAKVRIHYSKIKKY